MEAHLAENVLKTTVGEGAVAMAKISQLATEPAMAMTGARIGVEATAGTIG
jgi:hypothetical protein